MAPFRYEQKLHERGSVQRDETRAAAKQSRSEDIPLPPESEPAADFGFGGANMFASGNDLMRKNVEQMRKIRGAIQHTLKTSLKHHENNHTKISQKLQTKKS